MTSSAAQGAPASRVTILGSPVDAITMETCLVRLAELVASDGSHLVVTADSSSLVRAQWDEGLQDVYRQATLITPDSAGVVWAAKRAGASISHRVSGVEILDRVCALSAERGWRLFFLGAEPGVAELAAERLRLRHPGCNIVGARHGYFPPESDAVVAAEIAPLKPDVLFVAMGIPRQEKFILKYLPEIGAKFGVGVGGSFDVFSGKVKRAPVLFQRLHLEWLWRVLRDPTKLSKIKLLPRFVWDVLRSAK